MRDGVLKDNGSKHRILMKNNVIGVRKGILEILQNIPKVYLTTSIVPMGYDSIGHL